MSNFCIKENDSSITVTNIPAKAWRFIGYDKKLGDRFETTGDLKKIASRNPDNVRGWARSKADAKLGRTFLPLVSDAELEDGVDYDSTIQERPVVALSYDADNDVGRKAFNVVSITRKEWRAQLFEQGMYMFSRSLWRTTQEWNDWRSLMQPILKGLYDDSLAPNNVSFPKTPSPLEIT